ncbi:FAD-dependent oxidoreductase [Raoultibacter timonensis]|uniref:FAD-dependent oxidoreductase n=1 Tax=Raoultibacter timonensis TaxID=1907662 RepID=UPI000C86369D|nr:FAD-binding protein [Raoultibacter timonensis]
MESLGKTPFSRRGFLAGVALAGVGGALGLSGCAPQEQTGQGETASTESAASSASDWLGSEPEIQEADVVETLDAEILIIGAGTGGLFAACAAGELGADTVVLEKFEGGVVRDDVGGVNSRLQQENGYSIDKQAFMRDMYRYAAGQCDLSLFDIWFENSGSVVDWYEEVLGQYGVTLWHEMAEEKNIPNYPHWATGHSPAWPQDGSLSGFSVLSDYAEKTGHVAFRYNTPMVKLIVEDGKVVGAYGKGEQGYVRVNASKGTLVCTGGYGANVAMQKVLQPHTTTIYGRNTSQPGCDGDGIKACLWAGAKMDETHTSMLFDRTVVPVGVQGGCDCTEGTLFWMGSQPWLKVNLNGERFCNESGTYDYILHADAYQPSHMHVTLWDSDYERYAEQFDMHGCSRLFPFDNGAAPNIPLKVVQGMNADLLEKGYIQQADTIEELAEKLKLPVDTLVATVERNNENYDNQSDPDFGKEPFRLSALRNPPFYGVYNTGTLLCTLDGIVINSEGQALRDDGSAIEGLYVAGNDSGGFYSMTYPNLTTGNACGRTVTFARMIAQKLASS